MSFATYVRVPSWIGTRTTTTAGRRDDRRVVIYMIYNPAGCSWLLHVCSVLREPGCSKLEPRACRDAAAGVINELAVVGWLVGWLGEDGQTQTQTPGIVY
jgi:hypothetical protein